MTITGNSSHTASVKFRMGTLFQSKFPVWVRAMAWGEKASTSTQSSFPNLKHHHTAITCPSGKYTW